MRACEACGDAYLAWCKENNVRAPLTSQEMGARLRDRGVDGKSHGERVWTGVAIHDADGWAAGWAGHGADETPGWAS